MVSNVLSTSMVSKKCAWQCIFCARAAWYARCGTVLLSTRVDALRDVGQSPCVCTGALEEERAGNPGASRKTGSSWMLSGEYTTEIMLADVRCGSCCSTVLEYCCSALEKAQPENRRIRTAFPTLRVASRSCALVDQTCVCARSDCSGRNLGNRWAQIEQLLPGRSSNAVKRHFAEKMRVWGTMREALPVADRDEYPHQQLLQSGIIPSRNLAAGPRLDTASVAHSEPDESRGADTAKSATWMDNTPSHPCVGDRSIIDADRSIVVPSRESDPMLRKFISHPKPANMGKKSSEAINRICRGCRYPRKVCPCPG